MRSIVDLWGELRADRSSGDGILVVRVDAQAACNISAGLRRPSDVPALVLEVRADVIPAPFEPLRSRGLELSVSPVPGSGSSRVRLVLSLSDSTFEGIFGVLAQDVVERVSVESDDPAGFSTFVRRVQAWQVLLQRIGADGLTLEDQRGLYGELYFLRAMILPSIAPAQALAGWGGPLARNHDFEYDRRAWEVKTTVANEPEYFHVANILQMDEGPLDSLVVVHLGLREQRTVGESLPALVSAIHKICAVAGANASEVFAELLMKRGYLDIHSKEYESHCYTLRTMKYFRVAEGFPRLLARDVPKGVRDIRYSVLLNACGPYEIDKSGAEGLLRKGGK